MEPSYDPISSRYEPRSPPYELCSACFITPSPPPDPKTEAPGHSNENPCLCPSYQPEAGYRDQLVTLSDASSEKDILTYSLGSEVEGKPLEAVSPAKAGGRHRSHSPRKLCTPPKLRFTTQLGPGRGGSPHGGQETPQGGPDTKIMRAQRGSANSAAPMNTQATTALLSCNHNQDEWYYCGAPKPLWPVFHSSQKEAQSAPPTSGQRSPHVRAALRLHEGGLQ